MSAVVYDMFLKEVLPYVHDCPTPVAINAIRNACIEFCEQTELLLHEHNPITVVPNVGNYELDLPTYTTAVRIYDGWYQDWPLEPKGADELKDMFKLDWRSLEGRPVYYTQLIQEEVILVPKPTESVQEALKLIVVISPTRASTQCDSMLFENYAEDIGFGARARLQETPGQPYSDLVNAKKLREMFNYSIGKARIERARGLTRSNIVARPPPFV